MRHRRLTACAAALAASICAALAASPGVSAEPPPPAAATAAPGNLGTNLGGIAYYDGIVPFADLMRQASDWIPQADGQPWGTGAPLALRRDGWPARLADGQYATAVLAENRYPAGTYRVTWQGTGTFDINGTDFRGPDRRGTVTLDGRTLTTLNIRATDPRDPLRRITVTVPGEDPGSLYRTAYLRSLAPYATVRFMDWQRTNNAAWETAPAPHCRDRITLGYYSQGTAAGASVQAMTALANTLHADPWFTIPHAATAGWIRCHARTVARTLDPALTPRYEYSNETWNPAFRAFHDLTAQATRLGLGDGDPFLGLQQRTAQQHIRAMRIVTAEFAAAHRPVIRVLAGQAANAWVLEQRLATPGALAATDEIAIAPYLGVGDDYNPYDPADANRLAALTPAQILRLLADAQTRDVDPWITDHVALARQNNLPLVAYEGGQHLAGDPGNSTLTDLYTTVNRDPRIGPVYRAYLEHWRDLTGNALFMHYTDSGPYTEWGSWGALEYPDQRTSPKYDELVAYAAG